MRDTFNNDLRKRVKLLKALQDIKYKEVAEYLEVKQGSFLNWLAGSYDYSLKRAKALEHILENLQE